MLTSRTELEREFQGKRVEVYWNLHRHVFSVRALEGPDKGKVVAHVPWVELAGVTFSVQQAGRRKVLATGRKNVHAFVRGTVAYDRKGAGWRPRAGYVLAVKYNPREDESFVSISNLTGQRPWRPIHRANGARLVRIGDKPQVTAEPEWWGKHTGTKYRHLIATKTKPRALPELVAWGRAVRRADALRRATDTRNPRAKES